MKKIFLSDYGRSDLPERGITSVKKCNYCGTLNDNTARKCKGCTANDFTYICDNCGSEITNGTYCSRCGVKLGSVRQICPNCGTSYYTNACPNCGFIRHRTDEPAVRFETVSADTPKKKRSGWATFGLVLLWIYFLPIMGTIAIWKSKNIPTVFKWVITLVIWGITLLIYSNTPKSADTSSGVFTGMLLRGLV